MSLINSSTDTIVAIATPPGRGGVGILRLSGPLAYKISFQLNDGKGLEHCLARYCSFKNHQKELIDNGFAIYFKSPNSFTGEDIVELQVHGSPMVLDELLTECIRIGARIAKPGEFCERAFLNNKIDLTQAEAIADLIDASSRLAARMAIASLQGDFSKEIKAFNEELLQLRLFVEAAIDFPEEEIDFLNDGKVCLRLDNLLKKLSNLRENAFQGSIIREGLSVVIAGIPNAGKSSIINCLAGRDVAIVTEIAGTTRDVNRLHILIDDIPIHLSDTAGLRESDDLVEKEGIKRALKEISEADCILIIKDVNSLNESFLDDTISTVRNQDVPIIYVYNKIDLCGLSPKTKDNYVYISAKFDQGLDLLKEKIKQVVGYQPKEGRFLARRRHLAALDLTKKFLTAGRCQLTEFRLGELLAEDLRFAHLSLCEITGEFSSDDLLGKIFSSFCIGK